MWYVVNLSPSVHFLYFFNMFYLKEQSVPEVLLRGFSLLTLLMCSLGHSLMQNFFSKIDSDNFRQIEVKGQTRSFFIFFEKMFKYGHVAYQKLRIEERFNVMPLFFLCVAQFPRYCTERELDTRPWVIFRQICARMHTI